MSLYNLLHGMNPKTSELLNMIGLNINMIPRFRDCYEEDEIIIILTRTGGGNRDFYEDKETNEANYPEYNYQGPFNEDLRQNSYFIEDKNEEFDTTYAEFYFRKPTESN